MEVLGAGAQFAVIVGGMLGLVQFGFLWRKDRRQRQQAQARFGYDLLDAIFENTVVSALLAALDYENRPSASSDLAKGLRDIFGAGTTASMADRASVYEHVDALLFHFDRLEHAIQAELTLFEDVKTPLGYYVTLVPSSRRPLEDYATRVGYGRAVAFLRRFGGS